MTDKCCLCGRDLPEQHPGRNNPYPLAKKGSCCGICNITKVIPARMKETKK